MEYLSSTPTPLASPRMCSQEDDGAGPTHLDRSLGSMWMWSQGSRESQGNFG